MKVTLYYKGLAAFLSLFVLLIVSPTYVRADEVDIKPCYECPNCVIDPVTLEPEPPLGETAIWIPCSDPSSINLCSNGVTAVAVLAESARQPRTGASVGGDRLVGDQCRVRDAISQCSRRATCLGASSNDGIAGADVSAWSATRNDPFVPGAGEHRLVLVLWVRPVRSVAGS